MLTVASQGFADFVAPRVVVEVGQTARVDVAMKIEALTENVEVLAGGIAVDTSQTTVGGVVNLKQINELPLNGRNYLELAQLQPGRRDSGRPGVRSHQEPIHRRLDRQPQRPRGADHD